MKPASLIHRLALAGCLLLSLVTAPRLCAEDLLAFPGARGEGRNAQGGRNGSVYHVTNLNDSGSGSLRDAVSQPNRIVVFDVAGVINLKSRLVVSHHIYLAGQSAPGEGITVYGNGVSFSGASHSIVRYMRFRMGKNGDSGKDCGGIANGTHIILDHCSFAWGLDETFSINSDGKGNLGYITLSNCIVGQGLLPHSAGGLMQADHLTLYRNFYCDNSTRNNKVKGIHQYVNNIVYNWSNGCYLMGGDSQGSSYANTVGNLFINGPSGGGNACTSANADFHLYADDNWQDRNRDGLYNPYEIPQNEYTGGPTFEAQPYDYPELDVLPASELIAQLLPVVGASLPYRDYTDCYMVDECLSFGTKGALISTETILPYGVPSSWTVWKGNTRVDSDGDGMPDAWESAHGTNPHVDDAMVIAANGYANIENYLNGLTVDDRDFFLRAPICLKIAASTQTSITLEWYDFTDNEEGFIVEQNLSGGWTEVARTPNASALIEGLPTPATSYLFRVCAYKGEDRSAYVSVSGKTQPEQIDLIDIDTFIGETANLEEGKAVLIDTDTDLVKTLTSSVSPTAVVVKGKGKVTIDGSGSIAGSGSLNKAGEGELVLATQHSYTGPTVLHEGVIHFATLANGGVASSIGASQEFGQYWVWNGGTWNYTGGSVSTNRSANLLNDTRFCVASPEAVVSMSGTLQGNGSLIIGGQGQVKPTSSAFFGYEGETRLEGGTLYLNGVSTMWSDKQCRLGSLNKLVLAGGSLETKDANDTYSTYTFDMETVEGTCSSVSFHRNCSIRSKVYGSGDLIIKVNYLREYIRGNWDGFTGRLYATGSTGKSGEQQLLFDDSFAGIRNGVVELKGKNTQIVGWKAGATYYLGGLAGDANTYLSGFSKNTDSGSGTWIVGGAGTDETFNGVIDNRCSASGHNCTVNIVKEGAGSWTLNGNNIYKGTTKVNDGWLIVNGSHTGGGAYTVGADAVLAGTGSLSSSVNVAADGTLCAGLPNGEEPIVIDGKALTLNGALTLSQGGRLLVPIGYRLEPASSTSVEAQPLSAYWAHDTNGGNASACVFSDETLLTSSSYAYDNTVTVVDTVSGYIGGDGLYPLTPVTWYKSSASSFTVSFNLRLNKAFKPTRLEAVMLRAGTDGTLVDVTYQIGTAAAQTLSTGVVPKRNNKSQAQETKANSVAEYTADIQDVEVPAGTTLNITFKVSCAAGKSFGLSHIRLSGTHDVVVEHSNPDEMVYTAKSNVLTLSNATVNGGRLVLDTQGVETELQEGAAFYVFKPLNTVKGEFSAIEPAVPGEGLVWDTSLLYSQGILKAAKPTALDAATAEGPATGYTLQGRKVKADSRGIVIVDGKKYLNR